ncbi:hypothetical protein SELMODRAFT_403983 [Selaginella moellendorffii]|uniref:F-box domain-containing protein n=1 Tax=Selaginella moellendorffii TaxID=88036 RepID=D8QT71_SELML|nr:F-box/kelch-repeat protein At1g80440 [Selaginella moellendorffii]EFJ37065.1 hypothetical protein SELMODRAFT_403983 [Selaginella moellendorffii]|eukprot:XP_002961805.1 F-box/kelch-repeat protein At1g80440 [Selaginella moellendorffii]
MDWNSAFKDLDGVDLIPGLPDHLVIQRVLSRISWWDFSSAIRVSRGWLAAIQETAKNATASLDRRPRLLGCIHPASSKRPKRDQQSRGYPFFAISIQAPGHSSGWEILPSIPGLSCGAPLSGRCVCVDSKLFVLGGRDPRSWEFLPDVFVLDLTRGCGRRTWQRCAPMATPRSAFACIAVGGKIVVAGGQGDEVLTLASAEIYDVCANRWEPLPDLNVPRTECNGGVIGGRICVVGGYSSVEKSCELDDDQSTFWVSSADAISIGAKSWETIEDFQTPGILPGYSWEIQSGILQSVHRSVLGGLLNRCSSNQWRTIDGKIACSDRPGEDGNATAELMVLAAACGKDQVYACSCSLDPLNPSGRVKVLLCRAASGGELVKWDRVECPFELAQYGASCFLIH